ncbi:MAG: T9SS type A sorting domain-containing protein [Prolixibacteraceae bacterium]|nr:T9SS type A sorting domain-containing protein [Prolixibacteraceae bacterium]
MKFLNRFLNRNIIVVFVCFVHFSLYGQDNIAFDASDVTTSYVSSWEDLNAINDGYEPQNSGDKGPGAYGNWRGDAYFNQWNWVAYEFDDYYLIDHSEVYWWTDGLGIYIPYDTYIQYWDIFEGDWKTIENFVGNGVASNQYNVTTFPPVLTNKIKLFCISQAAQGILEWKVFGVPQENVPDEAYARVNQPLSKNVTTTVTVSAISASLPVGEYQFYIDIEVKNNLEINDEIFQIAGSDYRQDASMVALEPTNEEGVTQFEINLPEVIDPTDGIEIKVLLNNGETVVTSLNYIEPGKVPPVLNADLTAITVDNIIEIDFADNADWRNMLTSVSVNGIALEPSDFELSEGLLSLYPANGNVALIKSGEKNIEVFASGYEVATVKQEILTGTINAGSSYVDRTVKVYRPSTSKIPVYAYDTFDNPVSGYQFTYDIEVVNNNGTTDEKFTVNGNEITASSTDNSLSKTDANGMALLEISVPPGVDINDGLLIHFKLNDHITSIDEPSGYIRMESEKEVYVPKSLINMSEFKWEQTRQSENFTAFWGDKAGPNPTTFDPKEILDNLEYYYSFYIDSMKFVTNPDSGNMAKYKFVVILFGTFNNGFEDNGTAYGGSVDGVIGAMWMGPRTGFVVAHEFGHACQAMIPIQYPGKGFKNRNDNQQVGMYWEACANYMAFLSSGSAGNMLSPLFLNTSMLQYLSTIDSRQYESVYLPAYIIDRFGIEALGLQWRGADVGDNPFDALVKGLEISRDSMRKEAGLWAMHNVTWDYSWGNIIRSYLNGQDESAVCREFTHLESIESVPGVYIVPREMAPADYGYNIIPVYPEDGATAIEAELSGIDNDPAGGGGWSYGFVAVNTDGLPRYGDVALETDEKALLTIEPGDSLYYLVVVGCPPVTHTYAWTPSWPLVYRFPYMLTFKGAVPEGFQSERAMPANVAGKYHSNGGGWVASTASVDASVYVGPNAQVLGSAKVSGNARIEDLATVQDNASVSGDAVVKNNAIVGKSAKLLGNALVEKSARVWGGQVSDNAVVTGNAVTFNCRLSGNAVIRDVAWISGITLSGYTTVGGDMRSFKSCSEGNYLSLNQSVCNGDLWNFKLDDKNQPVEYYTWPYGDIPLTPANLAASAISGNSVELNWEEAPDNNEVTSYIVFVNNKYHQLVFGTSGVIENLKPETTYSISMIARDNTGNFSLMSDEVEVKTPVSAFETGISELNLKIQPNPVTDRFCIEFGSGEKVNLTISNLLGDVVYQADFSGSLSIQKSDVGGRGIYFARVEAGGRSIVKKFIVSR